MPFEGPRDLAQEHLNETIAELAAYKENKAVIDTGEAPEGTLGLQAGQRLAHSAEQGKTYEDIQSTPEEIEALFGPEMRVRFDQNK